MTASARLQAMVLIVASAGALAVVHDFPAAAAQEHPRPKRTAATGSKIPTGHIRIENHEASTLLSLSLVAGANEPNVVATGVPSGGSVVVALPKAGECVYDIKASFEDWSWVEVSGFDLCKDQTLKLGEGASAKKGAPSAPATAAKPQPAPAAAERRPAAKVGTRQASAPLNPAQGPAKAARIARTEPLKARRRPINTAAAPRILVENHHPSTLLSLTFAIRGEGAHLEAQLLPSGASTMVALPKAGQCVYDVQVEFSDDSGFALPGYDLCKAPTLNFK